MKKIRYLHTINGRVAGMSTHQICYASAPRKNGWHAKALKTLEEIKLQQKQSMEYRKENNFSKKGYGYLIIEI